MKIKLNGDIVENTDSIKNYKPRMRPGYKGKWEASQDNNKVLLVSLALMIFMCFGIFIGSDIRVKQYKDDLAALESVRTRELSIAYDNIVAYNELLTEYASVSAKLAENKLSPKAKAHVKQQPVVADKIKQVFGEEWAEATELFSRESSLNPQAVNPSSQACGLVQALPCSKLVNTCSLSDVDCQLDWGLKYIKSRYGSASAALAYHDVKGWY